MDESEPVVVARARTESEAAVIKSFFAAYGIRSHYTSEMPSRFYPTTAEDLPWIRIFVPAALADDSRALLETQVDHSDTDPDQ